MPATRAIENATDYPKAVEALESLTPLEELERREIEKAAAIHEKHRVAWQKLADALGITKKTLWVKRTQYDLP